MCEYPLPQAYVHIQVLEIAVYIAWTSYAVSEVKCFILQGAVLLVIASAPQLRQTPKGRKLLLISCWKRITFSCFHL